MVSTEGEIDVLKNLQRKSKQADEMFDMLVGFMNDAISIDKNNMFTQKEELPKWA